MNTTQTDHFMRKGCREVIPWVRCWLRLVGSSPLAQPLMGAKVRHENSEKGLHDMRSFIGAHQE